MLRTAAAERDQEEASESKKEIEESCRGCEGGVAGCRLHRVCVVLERVAPGGPIASVGEPKRKSKGGLGEMERALSDRTK